ncbi:DUF6174 domain-containing protein [Nocardioides sp.]|uniref:DUF6174 domain-containing protein n=1 Tax=Nocardioides sp. TaxID=35761 RepID=UPI0035B352D4
MKRAWLVLLLAFLVGVGPSSYAATDLHPVDPFVPGINEDPDLSRAWQRWQAKEIDDYVITVRTTCFCVPREAVRTVVRDDSVVRVTRGDHRLRAAHGWSMDELYILLREALATADSVDVDFSPRGVPTSIAIDQDKDMADEERYYTVSLSRL